MPNWLTITIIVIAIILIIYIVIAIVKGSFEFISGIFCGIALIFITIFNIVSWPIRMIVKLATRKKQEAKAKEWLEQVLPSSEDEKGDEESDNNNNMLG